MKLREIERLRAVAVLFVMAVHWSPFQTLLPWYAHDSWSGVDLFFVISGYVVTLSLVRLLPSLAEQRTFIDAFERARVELKTFYVRRFFRIMPAALAVLLATRVLVGLFPDKFGVPRLWTVEFLSFLGGVYNYVRPYHDNARMGVYWSLAVEEHFYLLLPVLFIVCRTTSRRLAACLGLALFSIVARTMQAPVIGLDPDDQHLYQAYSSHLRFDSLMAGVALALVATHPKTPALMPKWFMRFVLLPVALFVLGTLPGVMPEVVMHRLGFIALWGLGGLLVAFAGQDSGYVLAFPGVGRVLEHIGGRSYALYLVHVPVMWLEEIARGKWAVYDRLIPASDDKAWLRSLVLFAAALTIAELLYRCVEQPFIRLGRILDHRARSGPSARPSAPAG